MWEYALLLVPLLFAWFAYDAMRVRETAIGLALSLIHISEPTRPY